MRVGRKESREVFQKTLVDDQNTACGYKLTGRFLEVRRIFIRRATGVPGCFFSGPISLITRHSSRAIITCKTTTITKKMKSYLGQVGRAFKRSAIFFGNPGFKFFVYIFQTFPRKNSSFEVETSSSRALRLFCKSSVLPGEHRVQKCIALL